MKTATTALLDDLKRTHGIESDYRVAQLLGITRAAISQYRGGQGMNDEIALKVAELLDRPKAAVLATLAAERAKTPEARAAWREAVKALGGKAAALLLAIAAGGAAVAPSPAQASSAASADRLYIM